MILGKGRPSLKVSGEGILSEMMAGVIDGVFDFFTIMRIRGRARDATEEARLLCRSNRIEYRTWRTTVVKVSINGLAMKWWQCTLPMQEPCEPCA